MLAYHASIHAAQLTSPQSLAGVVVAVAVVLIASPVVIAVRATVDFGRWGLGASKIQASALDNGRSICAKRSVHFCASKVQLGLAVVWRV